MYTLPPAATIDALAGALHVTTHHGHGRSALVQDNARGSSRLPVSFDVSERGRGTRPLEPIDGASGSRTGSTAAAVDEIVRDTAGWILGGWCRDGGGQGTPV